MEKKKQPANKYPIIVSLSVLAVGAACYFFIPDVKAFVHTAYDVLTSDDEERIKEWVKQFGIMGPLAIILAMVAQMFLFVVPNVLLMMIAIISYGPVWGSLIAFAGVFTSSSLGYVIGKKLNDVTIEKFVGPETQKKIAAFIHDYGFKAIMITRVSSFSNDALGFVAGMLEMEYKKYISATLIGITPLIVLLAIYGRNGKIEQALIWIAAASLIGLGVYIFIDKRRKRRKPGKTGEPPRKTTAKLQK